MTDERPWAGRRLHFIGIGGAGMSGLALVARALGADVSGSDRADSPTLERLRDGRLHGRGRPRRRERAAGRGAEVVYSTAVPPDNPERAVARERGQAELHRADLLAEITALRALHRRHRHARQDDDLEHGRPRAARLRDGPGYLVGGEVRSTGSNAGWGSGEWVVVEADESDRSLLKLHPDVAVLTNAELDHHATYALAARRRRDVPRDSSRVRRRASSSGTGPR